MKLAGQKAIVTGGASGLGAATAQALAKAGAKVGVIDLDRAGGESVAAEIGGVFAAADGVPAYANGGFVGSAPASSGSRGGESVRPIVVNLNLTHDQIRNEMFSGASDAHFVDMWRRNQWQLG